jgi:replicative DNA helicase
VYLLTLSNSVPTAENIVHYARLVKEKATLRRLIAACAEIQSRANGDFGDFEEFLDEAETQIFKVAQQNRRESYSSTGELMEEVLHNLEVRTAERKAVTGVPTGFTKLDEITAGCSART